jgi:hypothetical protein
MIKSQETSYLVLWSVAETSANQSGRSLDIVERSP